MKNEKGYSLVELMIALAIVGIMSITAGMVIHETVDVPGSGSEQVSALHAIQNAAHRIGIDGQTAKSATGGEGLTLILPDDSTIDYTLSGGELHRNDGVTDRIVASGIESVDFSIDGRLITMTITAASEKYPDISENGTYRICMRPTL